MVYWFSLTNYRLTIIYILAIPYTVRVATGDKKEHETTSNVYIVFIGTDGVSEKIPLELVGKEKFEAGSVNTFSVESDDVGDLAKIEVSIVF